MIGQSAGGTVLIVDDSEVARQVVASQLEAAGYATAHAASGEACLDWLRSNGADCVLLDLVMPGMDGLATLRALRRSFTRSQLPVVMLTAHADSGKVVEALGHGANDYVVKPADAAVLVARVETQVSRKRSEEELRAAQHELRRMVADSNSELAQADRRLEETQHQLGAALDAMSQEFALFDANDRLVLWNARFAEHFAASGRAVAAGDSFDGLLRHSLAQGADGEDTAALDAQVRERTEAHLRGDGSGEMTLGDGRTLLVTEARTPTGATVCVRTDITEHRRNEDALAESRARLEAVVRALPDLIFELDAAGRIVDLHTAQGEALAREDYLGRRIPDVMPEAAARTLQAALDTTLHTREPQAVEYTLTGHKRQHHFEARLVPLRESGVLVVVRNTTDAVEARRNVEAQAHLLRQIIDTVPHWISVKGLDLNYLHLNRALAQDLGLDVEALRAGAVADVVAALPPQPPRLMEMDNAVLATGQAVAEPALSLTLPDGTPQVRRTVKLPLRDEGGMLQGVVMWSEDVTEQVRAEEEARVHQHLLRQILDTLPHWISVKDTDGRYRLVNRAMALGHGQRVEDFQGRLTGDTRELGPGGLELMMRLDRKVLETGASVQLGEYTVTNLQGEQRTRRLAKFPLLGESGAVEGVVTWSEDVTEQRRVEAEVRDNRLLLRQIVDAVPHWITLKDPNGRYLMANRSAAEALQTSVESFLGRTQEEMFRYEVGHEDRIGDQDREILGTGRPIAGGDVNVLLPGGVAQVRNVVKTPLLDERGTLKGVVTWSEDVTEARRSEAELHAGRRLMRAIIDSLPFWISVKDREGRFRVINRAMADALGTTPDAMIGRTNAILGGTMLTSLDLLNERDQVVTESGQALEIPQVRLADRDGSQRVRRLAKFPLWDAEGHVEGVVSWSEDITERLQEEAVVERSRRLMAQAEEVARMGSLEWNLVTNEQFWSDSVYQLLGFEPQAFEATPQAFSSVLHPQDRKRVLAAMAAAAKQGRSVELECRVMHRDGRERILHARGEIMRDEEGRPQRMVGTVQDITESRKVEEEVRRSQRMEALGQLTGSVAHDFNNLLQIVNGYTHLARRRPSGDPLIGDDLQEVLAAAERGSNLARQLLAFSRRSHVQRRVLVLNDLVRDLEKMLRVAVGENVELVVELAPDTPLVEVDPGMIEQVLVNLAINGRDAMASGGTLTIRTRMAGDVLEPGAAAACIEIRDTGTGIPDEIRERIFDPYFSTKGSKGTGLGLATVYGIVQQHGGRIDLETQVGRGTTFTILLPAADAEPTPVIQAQAAVARGGRETILVADNDPQLLRMMEMLLRDKGYRLISARDGDEAVAHLEASGERIALAILDIRMPGTDGLSAGGRMRALRPRLPIIYSTGDAGVDGLDEVVRTPGQYLLSKPFTADQLYGVVRKALDEDAQAAGDGTTSHPRHSSTG